VTDLFFHIVTYIQLKQIIKKKNNVENLVLSIGCWLDGGRSKCKLAERERL